MIGVLPLKKVQGLREDPFCISFIEKVRLPAAQLADRQLVAWKPNACEVKRPKLLPLKLSLMLSPLTSGSGTLLVIRRHSATLVDNSSLSITFLTRPANRSR